MKVVVLLMLIGVIVAISHIPGRRQAKPAAPVPAEPLATNV